MGWPDGHTIAANGYSTPMLGGIANGLRASDGHHGYSSPRGDGGDNMIVGTLHSNTQGGNRTTDLNTPLAIGGDISDDLLLPLGLDSHRYRVCGNGVVAPVAEWLGRRIAEALA